EVQIEGGHLLRLELPELEKAGRGPEQGPAALREVGDVQAGNRHQEMTEVPLPLDDTIPIHDDLGDVRAAVARAIHLDLEEGGVELDLPPAAADSRLEEGPEVLVDPLREDAPVLVAAEESRELPVRSHRRVVARD